MSPLRARRPAPLPARQGVARSALLPKALSGTRGRRHRAIRYGSWHWLRYAAASAKCAVPTCRGGPARLCLCTRAIADLLCVWCLDFYRFFVQFFSTTIYIHYMHDTPPTSLLSTLFDDLLVKTYRYMLFQPQVRSICDFGCV